MRTKTENQAPQMDGAQTPIFRMRTLLMQPENKEWLHQNAWSALNFITVAGATSTGIVAAQSPVKTMILNLSKSGVLFPSATGGVFGLVRALYAGTAASLTGSAVRTVYVTGAKGQKPSSIEEAQIKQREMIGYILSAALGDIAITQVPESLSQLRKVPGLLPNDFKWKTPHNMYRLMMGGFVARYLSGLANFGSLCVLEDKYARRIPTENTVLAHFLAGGLSGMSAAVVAYPFAAFKDYQMVNATVVNGKLINKGALSLLQDMAAGIYANPKKALVSGLKDAGKQLPIRIGLTGVIFSIIAGVGQTLGPEPLKNVVPERYQPRAKNPQGFFANSAPKVVVEEEAPVKAAENKV